MNPEQIERECERFRSMKTQGELGQAVASAVLMYSPRDLETMRWNFSGAIQDITPDLRKILEESITGYLHGTYQALRLLDQQGSFAHMRKPLDK